MPLTTENTGAVLTGRPNPMEITMQIKKVKVTRPFYFNRTVQAKDAVVELPSLFASEMIAAKKAEPYVEPEKAPEPAKDPEGGRGKKESPDARK